jgi:predicted aconitase with swiveling domain
MTLDVLVDGECRGELLLLDEPLSLWGGVDPATGVIVEEGHPQAGSRITGRILVMPHGRGSSSSSSVLAELLRNEAGPAGIVLERPDSILVIGALVAGELYGTVCPVVSTAEPPVGSGAWRISGGRLEPVDVEVENHGDNADNH